MESEFPDSSVSFVSFNLFPLEAFTAGEVDSGLLQIALTSFGIIISILG